MMDIIKLLQLAKSKGASDLHIVADSPPLFRINGNLMPAEDQPVLSAEDIEQGLAQGTSEKERADFARDLELDFGRTLPDTGRVRYNAARQRGSITPGMRLLPNTIP